MPMVLLTAPFMMRGWHRLLRIVAALGMVVVAVIAVVAVAESRWRRLGVRWPLLLLLLLFLRIWRLMLRLVLLLWLCQRDHQPCIIDH